MTLDLLDRIGDWNPQMWREAKGRLKQRNTIIAATISLVGQLLLLLCFYTQLPIDSAGISNRYCSGLSPSYNPCVQDAASNFAINWSLWWQDVFFTLSFIGIFVLLTGGIYLLIGDFSQEERRGTLNFIRLSPQSEVSILTGKLLGVPILLYLIAALALPLHLWAGLSGEIPLARILGFYAVVAASCIFFYSGALLCSAVSAERGWALAWLGAGGVLLYLLLTLGLSMSGEVANHPSAWLKLFSPINAMTYLLWSYVYSEQGFGDWSWYYLPVGASVVSRVGFTLLNYGLWTYWIWQALKRCFRNPNGTILSKRQSYWLVGCFEVTLLGFVAQGQTESYTFWGSFGELCWYNVLLLFALMAVLSPQRQALLDWTRYRREGGSKRKGFWNHLLVRDLIWDEKSPAVVAMAINLAIAATPVTLWILVWSGQGVDQVLFGVAFFVSLMLIYATLAQMMLLIKAKKRSLWATGTVATAIFLPPTFLAAMGINPLENPTLWLFSTFPWAGMEYAATTTLLMALLGEWSILVLLNLRLTRQLQRAGESASKALFAGRPSLPAG